MVPRPPFKSGTRFFPQTMPCRPLAYRFLEIIIIVVVGYGQGYFGLSRPGRGDRRQGERMRGWTGRDGRERVGRGR